LLLPLLLKEAPSMRGRLHVLLGLAAAGVAWALVLRVSTGSFVPPYAANGRELSGEALLHQLRFFTSTTALLHLPVVLLAGVGLALRFSATWALAGTVVLYTAFYSLWRAPLSIWWESRFLLPVLPLLHLVAAEGWAALLERGGRVPRAMRAALGAGLVLGYGAWSVVVSPVGTVRHESYREYFLDSIRTSELVPAGALVGAVNHGGPLRFYAKVQSFLAWHEDAPALVRFAFESGRPVFAVLSPVDHEAVARRIGFPPFRFEAVGPLPSGLTLERMVPLAGVTDVGAPEGRAHLVEGFSGDEGPPGMSFAWAVGLRAVISLPRDNPAGGWLLSVHLSPFAGLGSPQELTVRSGGADLAITTLRPGFQTVQVGIPREHSDGPVELLFSGARSPASIGASGDERPLAAAVDWLAFTPLP